MMGAGKSFAQRVSIDSVLHTQTLVKNEKIRSFTSRKWGVLVPKNTKTSGLYSKMLVFHIILASGLLFFTNKLLQNRTSTDRWVHWNMIIGVFIYFSYYLGSLCAFFALLYISKDKIGEKIKKTFTKGKKEEKKE